MIGANCEISRPNCACAEKNSVNDTEQRYRYASGQHGELLRRRGPTRSAMSTSALLVLTTCANAAEADELAGALVEEKLAACVNRVDGVMSTYRWDSLLQRDPETLLLIKTTEARFDELQLAIARLSSYDVPEVIAVPVRKGSKAYLDWLVDSVS